VVSLIKPAAAYPPSSEERVQLQAVYNDLLATYRTARAAGPYTVVAPMSAVHFAERGVESRILQWLLYQGHVRHFKRLEPASDLYVGGPVDSVLINGTSSFALAEAGYSFIQSLSRNGSPIDSAALESAADQWLLGRLIPRYVADGRVFTWGAHVLKEFRNPAPNQVALVEHAEKQGWPSWMDDPLPRVSKSGAKVRLRYTVEDLNKFQRPYLVHFKLDGTGRRWGWELR
jgi:hypothetical protein